MRHVKADNSFAVSDRGFTVMWVAPRMVNLRYSSLFFSEDE